MAFKPNYNLQRSERTRLKEAKKQEKLQKREADAQKRRDSRERGELEPRGPDSVPDPSPPQDE